MTGLGEENVCTKHSEQCSGYCSIVILLGNAQLRVGEEIFAVKSFPIVAGESLTLDVSSAALMEELCPLP